MAPGRMSDVGQGQCQEKFFMVGRSVGRRGVRQRRALSDSGRRTDGSFYFFLEPPNIIKILRIRQTDKINGFVYKNMGWFEIWRVDDSGIPL